MSVADSAAKLGQESGRRVVRGVLGTVPIALVSSLAVTFSLVPPAQAAAPRTADPATEKAADDGPVTSAIGTTAAVSQGRMGVAAAPATYRVQSGDTVSGIAARFGLPTAAVLARNGLSWKSLIFPGQVLALGGAAEPAPAPAPSPAPAAATGYSVVSGDTISGIAAKFGVSVSSVLSANHLTSSSLIFPGQRIAIPGMQTAALSTPVAPVAPVAAPAPLPVAVAGKVVALTDEMRANAQLIIRIGRSQGVSERGIIIALAAAAQESGLRNVRYGDRDSLGLFQQRPSTGWGTPAQVLDPTRATLAFFGGRNNPNTGRTHGLLDIPGWSRMTLTQAAQSVQLSAFPDAYAKWETSATAWFAQLG